jgi:hypothetical protein
MKWKTRSASLDYGDLNARAGQREWGYVDPGDAATEILEEAIDPFLDDLSRRLELGFEAEALDICKGVVLGLYRLHKGEACTLVDWAPDFPSEGAGLALEKWRDGLPNKRAFPDDFVARFVPDWSAMIERILRRKKQGK